MAEAAAQPSGAPARDGHGLIFSAIPLRARVCDASAKPRKSPLNSMDVNMATSIRTIPVRHRNFEAKVKVGGRYRVELRSIEVDSVDLVPFSSVSPADVRSSGERSREDLRRRAAHAGPIDDDTWLYRVEFHVVSDENP